MLGRDALWQPGTDHAGIATQMVVERQLETEQSNRHKLGREGFVERVWKWKAESGGTITRQLRALGASPDWARERFTMDEGLSAAVRRVFVRLYKDGLIYRDKRLVNWDPRLHTAISDLEVESLEINGHLWHFRYPVEGAEGQFIVVATTRPETMLGDTAVAVHPEDDRYRLLVGKHVILPLVGRRIPIIADDYADPTTGSGAVKITPAHDFNDFQVGRRHGLDMINILDADAHLNDAVPQAYRGLDRFDARKRVVADLDALGLVEKIEAHRHTVPHGDRSGVPIEPWLSDQWYCNAAKLAEEPIRAVEEGRTAFVPRNWENTFFEWMRNIQPWNISRQLWWGHQIPAWYGPDGAIFVEESEAEAQAAAKRHYGKDAILRRDEDVLDTWFSSALWPFSTLGWPDETAALKRYYPGDVLVTGFDIIFFWVARMMMMGHYVMRDVPFRTVYIHALVRDERGQKMSKSKGNIIDPLVLIDKYGCDALRFTLIALAAQGRDIKLAESRVEGYRNFVTKLWNAARFCEINECRPVSGFDPARTNLTVNRWLVAKIARAAADSAAAIQAYRFNDAASVLYVLVWNIFCDWYLEIAKPILQGDGVDESMRAETRAMAAWALETIVHLLHPLMPFVTEELWQRTGESRGLLMTRAWPTIDFVDAAAQEEMDWLVGLITGVRVVRAEMNVPPSVEAPLRVAQASARTKEWLGRHDVLIRRLARLSSVETVDGDGRAHAAGSIQLVVGEATAYLHIADIIDLAQERGRLAKEIARLAGEIEKIDRKLANADFIAKAKPEVVEEQRERREELSAAHRRLSEALGRLASA
jgi:valyl-tRNA synthetase